MIFPKSARFATEGPSNRLKWAFGMPDTPGPRKLRHAILGIMVEAATACENPRRSKLIQTDLNSLSVHFIAQSIVIHYRSMRQLY
jgi:hypothetical protein